MVANEQPKLVFLTSRQISAVLALVQQRLTELILVDENPNIIRLYQSVDEQLRSR